MSRERFYPMPGQPRFARLFSNDKVYRIYRQHPIVLVRGLLWPTIVAVPVLLILLAFTSTDATLAAPLLLLALLVFTAWIGYIIADWRADYLAVTNRRVLVHMERPGISRQRREIPLGKVQNVITKHGGIVSRLVRDSSVTLDTSGLGRVTFDNMLEDQAGEVRELVLWLQKSAQAGLPSKEEYRQQAIRSMLYGTPPPQKPVTLTVEESPRTGYGLFNTIFPINPQREGKRVVWHKHWWFLIVAIKTPLAFLLAFEILNLIVFGASNLLQLGANPLIGILAGVRIFFYIGLIAFLLWQWQDWRNDEYILDGDRLIDRETLPFKLNESVKETELRRVTDATVTVIGVVPNLLRFGDVVIKTPGEATEFTFDGVPNPFEVQREIMHRLEVQRESDQAQSDRDIQEWLRTYIEERRAEPTPNLPQQPRDDWNLGW